VHHESAVERTIREAIERGEFDDLPGKGKPLPQLEDPREDWWIRGYVRREGVPSDALLPTGVQLRKEVERLPETVRDLPSEQAVRAVVAALNARVAAYVRTPEGPVLPVRRPDPDELVTTWRAHRAARAETVRDVRRTDQRPPRRRWRRS